MTRLALYLAGIVALAAGGWYAIDTVMDAFDAVGTLRAKVEQVEKARDLALSDLTDARSARERAIKDAARERELRADIARKAATRQRNIAKELRNAYAELAEWQNSAPDIEACMYLVVPLPDGVRDQPAAGAGGDQGGAETAASAVPAGRTDAGAGRPQGRHVAQRQAGFAGRVGNGTEPVAIAARMGRTVQ